MRGKGWIAASLWIPATIFLALIAGPLAMLVGRSEGFTVEGGLSPTLWPVVAFTLKQAVLSLLLSLACGVSFGVLAPLGEGARLKRILFSIFSLPSLSVAGGGLAFLHAVGSSPGWGWIVAAHVYLNAPWIAMAVIEARENFPQEWKEAARSLGAGKRVFFLRLSLPWIGERLMLAAAQVFSFCVMSFTLVFLLGGGPPASTLETEIYILVRGSGLALGEASQFAIAQILIAGTPLLLATRFRIQNRGFVDRVGRLDRRVLGLPGAWSGFSILAALLLFFPLAALGMGAFALPEVRALEFWVDIACDPGFQKALKTSLTIATLTTFVALAFGIVFVWGGGSGKGERFFSALAGVPAGISPFVLCLGFFLFYSHGGWIDALDPFEGSAVAIVLIQATLLLPFGARFLIPLREGSRELSQRRLRFIARSLGAGSWRSWKEVEWPRIREGIVPFLRLAWTWSFMDLTVAVFFSSEELFTLPVWLARKLSRYEFAASQAVLFLMSALLILVFILGVGEERRRKDVEWKKN